MIGLSTSWQSAKIDSGKELLDRILNLGVEAIELDYRVTIPMFREMLPILKKKLLSVLSIHNFFPLPENFSRSQASGDLLLLSSTDKEEREKAIKYTIKTIRLAFELEVKAVVLHLGRVEMETDPDKFFDYYDQKKIDSLEAKKFLAEQKHSKGLNRQKYLDSVLFSLDKLNKEADKRGVLLGMENRYYFHEIPDETELGIIFQQFAGSNIRYWHDVGHAGVQENLGILSHQELLKRYQNHLAGIHLHDLNGYEDHFAPGTGELNYELIKDAINPETIKIMELHSKVSQNEVKDGLAFLKNCGIS